MATVNKKTYKFQPPDWFTNSFIISSNARRQNKASHDIRQETRALRLSTELRSKWDNYCNTNRLADRIDTILNFKDILELARSTLDDEIALLNSGKEAMENQIADIQINEDCNIECLTIRDCRRGIDFVEDKPECELRMEQELLFKCRKRLQHKVDEAFDQLLLLQESRQQILKDLQDKNKTLEIDQKQFKLTKECPGVSFKVNQTRVPQGTTTLQQWEEFTRYNWRRTETEVGASQRLREAIFSTMRETDNDLAAQGRAVDFALRRRSHEDKQALDEMNWQKKTTQDEIAEIINDLDKLELEMQSEGRIMKVAETRQERRTYRTGVELCRDGSQYALMNEVKQLDVSKKALLLKQHECRSQLDALQKLLRRIREDSARKENSQRMDINCLELRRVRIGGSGYIEGRDILDCKELLEGHRTGNEGVCAAAKLDKVPTYSKLESVTAACVEQTC